MADICPNCNSADVQHGLDSAYCLSCGKQLTYGDSGAFSAQDVQVASRSVPADTSLAIPTAAPVYAEQESDRQPARDTNLEPVPSDAAPGPNLKPSPDAEEQNIAGALSDETPEEKATEPAPVPEIVTHSTDDINPDTGQPPAPEPEPQDGAAHDSENLSDTPQEQ